MDEPEFDMTSLEAVLPVSWMAKHGPPDHIEGELETWACGCLVRYVNGRWVEVRIGCPKKRNADH